MDVKVQTRKNLKYVAFRASEEEVQQVKEFVRRKKARGERLAESDVYRSALALFLREFFTERKDI